MSGEVEDLPWRKQDGQELWVGAICYWAVRMRSSVMRDFGLGKSGGMPGAVTLSPRNTFGVSLSTRARPRTEWPFQCERSVN